MHCLGKNLLVCLVTEVGNETALLGSQQVAGSANVKVLHGYVHAATELAEALDGLKTSAGIGWQRLPWWREHIAERLSLASSHASAHLVQVAQAEVLRLVYDDCIHIRYVNAVLHNRCGYEHVVVMVYELVQALLKHCRLHLSVAYAYACVGYMAPYHVRQFLHSRYAVGDKEHLAVTAELEVYGLLYHLSIEIVYLGVDGVAVRRRCLYHGEVACAHD